MRLGILLRASLLWWGLRCFSGRFGRGDICFKYVINLHSFGGSGASAILGLEAFEGALKPLGAILYLSMVGSNESSLRNVPAAHQSQPRVENNTKHKCVHSYSLHPFSSSNITIIR